MFIFLEGGKPEKPEKRPRSKARTNKKLNPLGQNQIPAILVGGERSHHCAVFEREMIEKKDNGNFAMFPKRLLHSDIVLKLISSPYCALSRVCLRFLFCFI